MNYLNHSPEGSGERLHSHHDPLVKMLLSQILGKPTPYVKGLN